MEFAILGHPRSGHFLLDYIGEKLIQSGVQTTGLWDACSVILSILPQIASEFATKFWFCGFQAGSIKLFAKQTWSDLINPTALRQHFHLIEGIPF